MPEEKERFLDHYPGWTEKRIKVILKHYGAEWFKGKNVLELGCGFAMFGNFCHLLGANVTVSDARAFHLQTVMERYPYLRVVQADLNCEFPFKDRHWDLILHLGVLYHLEEFVKNLELCCAQCSHMVLDTAVIDSSDPDYFMTTYSNGYDQAIDFIDSRASPAYIEGVLKRCGMDFEMQTSDLNFSFHKYDWPITDSKDYESGQRRFWFCRTAANTPIQHV